MARSLAVVLLGISQALDVVQMPGASAFYVATPYKQVRKLHTHTSLATTATCVDISEGATRDIFTFEEWATNCGVQRASGFEVTPLKNDDEVSTTSSSDIPSDSPLLYVPSEMILTATKAKDEFGAHLTAAERKLSALKMPGQSEQSQHTAEFYLWLKILKEYELGTNSPWHPWLNSLPRYFSNGASMTDLCFGCLPPYAAELALGEKLTQSHFFAATLNNVPFLTEETTKNFDLAKWAYSIVRTRCMDMPNGDICLVPMADFFDHCAQPNTCIQFDEEGSCSAYAVRDISANDPLTISYGNPCNPSKLMARYGFLDESSRAQFCKILITNPSPQLVDMGYDHSRLLFFDTGEVSEEVWDVLLYQELQSNPEEQRVFYNAHIQNDTKTKQRYHETYFSQTLAALQSHVDYLITELEELAKHSRQYNVEQHPRLPLILRHNEFVRRTFERVQENLDNMR